MKDAQTALALADQQTAIQPITPMHLLQMAMQDGNLELVREFMQLRRDWEADEAKRAYTEAMAKFKCEPIHITKDKENKQYSSRYTSLGNLIETVNPFLAKYGFSHDWELDQTDGIKITCVMTHSAGHSKRFQMKVPLDTSGAKNPVQQIKSSITYGKICTFESACGLAGTDGGNLDDDGNGSAPHKDALPEEKSIPLQEAIKYARDLNELKAAFKQAYTMAVTIDDQNAFRNLYEARKKAMQ